MLREKLRVEDEYLPLFETKPAKGRTAYKLYAISVFVAIFLSWVYRVIHVPAAGEAARWPWIGLFMAELWFSFYWLLSQFNRWNPVYRYSFRERLCQRYDEKDLPAVDIFVCTADTSLEPPILVINSVLSVLAYRYPPDKLSVYLSDDAGSELMFYALLEASRFAKYWLPFCRNFNIEPRCPYVYFESALEPQDDRIMSKEWESVKKLYEDMNRRIEAATSLGQISKEIKKEHRGFKEWDYLPSSKNDHGAIIQILLNGRDLDDCDVEGVCLPSLIYVAREKRPQYRHNFKAGAMNALIRVSSNISNGSIILNLDCDVYSNDSESIRDALCYFMDEEKGHEIAYVQYPQNYNNLTKNDLYACCLRVLNELEVAGMDANGGPSYMGSGCFHRRVSLCGATYSKGYQGILERSHERNYGSKDALEKICRCVASCTFEEKTEWGKEVGLIYGYATEDMVTGLAIQCRGWKSVYSNPERKAFMGVATNTLLKVLIQHKRWSEGQFQIALSKSCPLLFGHKRIPLKLQISYIPYLIWAPNCVPTLYYVAVPSFCLLRSISLYLKISSIWILPFAYVFLAEHGYSLCEFLCCGGTTKGWWNEQRMWLYKRTTSYLYAFLETILKQAGFAKSEFVITAKVRDENVSRRYAEEIMEYGGSSPMFAILAAVAMINLCSLFAASFRMAIHLQIMNLESLAMQTLLSGLVVSINLPLYQALFLRKDKGSMPATITFKSVALFLVACSIAVF